MADVNCKSCRYWEQTAVRAHDPDNELFGTCRRHAPQPGVRDIIWPRVSSTEWCGDHASAK